MKVRMLTLRATPEGVYPIGSVADVTEAKAKELIEGRYAEPYVPKSKAGPQVVPAVAPAVPDPRAVKPLIPGTVLPPVLPAAPEHEAEPAVEPTEAKS